MCKMFDKKGVWWIHASHSLMPYTLHMSQLATHCHTIHRFQVCVKSFKVTNTSWRRSANLKHKSVQCAEWVTLIRAFFYKQSLASKLFCVFILSLSKMHGCFPLFVSFFFPDERNDGEVCWETFGAGTGGKVCTFSRKSGVFWKAESFDRRKWQNQLSEKKHSHLTSNGKIWLLEEKIPDWSSEIINRYSQLKFGIEAPLNYYSSMPVLVWLDGRCIQQMLADSGSYFWFWIVSSQLSLSDQKTRCVELSSIDGGDYVIYCKEYRLSKGTSVLFVSPQTPGGAHSSRPPKCQRRKGQATAHQAEDR